MQKIKKLEGPSDPTSILRTTVKTLAHDLRSPLMAVSATFEFLEILLSQVGRESEDHLDNSKSRSWLSAHLDEAVEAMRDGREGSERIRAIVQRLEEVHLGPQIRHSDFHRIADWSSLEGKTETKRSTRVLIVEDETTLRKALKRTLPDYDVVALAKPRSALARIVNGERFDVILCDLMMPGMTGSVLHEKIALLAPDQARRMIFMTGGATTKEAEDFLACVKQPVLTKPFDFTELRLLIETLKA